MTTHFRPATGITPLRSLLAALLCFILLAGLTCDVRDPAAPQPKALLLAGTSGQKNWKLLHITTNGSQRQPLACEQDDRYGFKRTKVLLYTAGNQCGTEADFTANWYLNDAETKMLWDKGEVTDTFALVDLAEDFLILARNANDSTVVTWTMIPE